MFSSEVGQRSIFPDSATTRVFEALHRRTLQAQGGDADALYDIAMLHLRGDDNLRIPKNVTKGIEDLTSIGEQGHARSQLELGMLYLKGKNVTSDLLKAKQWLELAGKQNLVDAQFELANLCLLNQDFLAAARWFRLAAENHHEDAKSTLHSNLGQMLFTRYHMRMLDNKFHFVCALLINDPKQITTEILFDLERSFFNKTFYENMQSLITIIREKVSPGMALDFFNQALRHFYSKYLFGITEQDFLCDEKLNLFFSLLQKIDLRCIEKEKIIRLIGLITDAYHRAESKEEREASVQSTMVNVDYLPILLYRLMVEELTLDNDLSKHCAIMILKPALGYEYFVNMTSISFKTLLMILPIATNDDMSAVFKVDLINRACQQIVLVPATDKKILVSDEGIFAVNGVSNDKGKGEAVTPSCEQ